MEGLLGVLGEFFEEEREQGVDVFSSGEGVGNRAGAVGVADVDGLIEEDDGGVGVPGVRVEG